MGVGWGGVGWPMGPIRELHLEEAGLLLEAGGANAVKESRYLRGHRQGRVLDGMAEGMRWQRLPRDLRQRYKKSPNAKIVDLKCQN